MNNTALGAKKRDLLTVWDLSQEELISLIGRAQVFKAGQDISYRPLAGKSVGLIFEKTSTRTRVSFEVGLYQLGAQAVYIKPGDSQLVKGETIADTARVMSRYLHGVVIRTYGHERLEEFAQNATIPVINGLTDSHHPCQAIADMMTIKEKKGRLQGVRMVYIGDGNNVANSLIEVSSLLGVDLTIACPQGYEPERSVLEKARMFGSAIKVVNHPMEAIGQADVLYTDVWISMGDKDIDIEAKKAKFIEFQLNEELLCRAKPGVILLHCLPAHRGEEITDKVLECPASVVFDQAENRLHTQKAVLEMLIR